MTRRGFEEVHAYLAELGLPAGDSFWLFDPSGGDMGLFTWDVDHPGPQHAWLLDQIASGAIDIIHSAGSYGALFNNGYEPQRDQIARALDYLATHARVPMIWTNHGDVFNIQNIGGAVPAPHHQGDVPGSGTYCLDLLQDHGVRYFWLDRLIVRDSATAYRVTATEGCRDGREIVSFQRFLSPAVDWSPNAQNFAEQLRPGDCERFVANQQDTVLYTHWGCHHEGRTALTPKGSVLTAESRQALHQFADTMRGLGAEIVPLPQLLTESEARPVAAEIQRIGAAVVRDEAQKPDTFYFNQYHKHGLSYFRSRIAAMSLHGQRALDAGCGVGQWSYALWDHYPEVHGLEMNADAIRALTAINRGLRHTHAPVFAEGSLEAMPYEDGTFDLVFCHGVLFCTHMKRSLGEIARVLAPGGSVYLCVNGDGWYEYLCDDRFAQLEDDAVLPYATPLWNALVARTGGHAHFEQIASGLSAAGNGFWTSPHQLRHAFQGAFTSSVVNLPELLTGYSDRVILLLGKLTRQHLDTTGTRPSGRTGWLARARTLFAGGPSTPPMDFPQDGIGSINRAVLPEEMKEMGARLGLELRDWALEAGLARSGAVRAIHQTSANGHLSVWECLLTKP